MRLFSTIFFISFLLAASSAQAQYYFETLNTQNGLSDNRVTCFFKDRKGFMWIGTANGLNRYDGHSFRIYRPGQQNFKLSGEFITGMAQDQQDRLWIATRGGLNVLNVEKDSLYIFSPDDDAYKQKDKSITSILIWDVKIDKQGRAWLACDMRDLCYYDPAKKIFIYPPWKKFAENLFPEIKGSYYSINKLYPRGDTAFWLGTTLGLFSYNILTKEFHFYGGDQSHDFISFLQTSNKVYFTQETGALQSIDLANNKYETFSPGSKTGNTKFNKLTTRNQITWLPGSKAVWELNNGIPTVLKHRVDNPFSSANANVRVVYTDNHNISWIGGDQGVTRFDPRLNRFSFTSIFPHIDSAKGNLINNIFYSEQYNTYFGISHQLNKAFSWNDREGYRELLSFPHFGPFMNFSSFYEDNDKRIWLLTARGIYQFDANAKKFRFFADPSGEPRILYTAMAQDAQGNYWVGSYPEGIFCYDHGSGKWSKPDTTGGFASRIVTALHFEKTTNQLWAGTFDYGVFRFDFRLKRWKYFGMNVSDPRFMYSSLITDISRDAAGNIWVSTNAGGISKFDASGKSNYCVNYKIENGLPDNTLHSLACDQKGNTWFTSFKGLTCIDTAGRVLRHFDNRNGLPYENYNSRLQVTSDGCIVTAIRNGFIRFHPDSMAYATEPYPVVITACSVKDSSLAYVDSLQHARNRFSHKMNEWQFAFTALNYTNPSAIRYFYKLDGYDDHWVEAGTTHTAKYTNLDNGQYTFRVKAQHPSGMYSANEATFAFSISPPFWKTWWFLALAVALVTAIVYFIYRYQLNKKLEVERLRLRISRDLHDDIGSALTSINVLSKVALSRGGPDMEIGGYLSQIKNAASDTMESMSDIVWAINPQNDKLEAVTSRMKEFAAEICEAKQVDLDFILPEEEEKISFDAGKRKNIFLIFKEAVNNAIKYSECTKLHIGFGKEGNKLVMQIKDNGKGFDILHAKTGNGLKSMKERAHAIAGTLLLHTKPGQGTAIKLFIPLD